jgi:hypothetical protein
MSKPTTSAVQRSPCDGPAHVISRCALGSVVLCRCGNLHLNLDFMTLRFEPQAFRELAGLLHGAQHCIDQRVARSDTSNVH